MAKPKRIENANSTIDLERWEPALQRVLKRCAAPGWFGTLKLEVADGQVKRLLVERSIKDPNEVDLNNSE